jgi:hypothetical protein
LSGTLGLGFDLLDLFDYAFCFFEIVIGLLSDFGYGLYDFLDYASFAGVDFLRRIGWRLFDV